MDFQTRSELAKKQADMQRALDKIHVQISALRYHLENPITLLPPQTIKEFTTIELALMKLMRRVRLEYMIPYHQDHKQEPTE